MTAIHTYTKTYLICPHCSEQTGQSIDHIEVGGTFGPWYCDECGQGFSGGREEHSVELRPTLGEERVFTETLDLLVLPPQVKPVYFVRKGRRSKQVGGTTSEQDELQHQRFFYEEHSCPTNWLSDIELISFSGDHDPHGLIEFVRSVPYQDPAIRDNSYSADDYLPVIFPEIA